MSDGNCSLANLVGRGGRGGAATTGRRSMSNTFHTVATPLRLTSSFPRCAIRRVECGSWRPRAANHHGFRSTSFVLSAISRQLERHRLPRVCDTTGAYTFKRGDWYTPSRPRGSLVRTIMSTDSRCPLTAGAPCSRNAPLSRCCYIALTPCYDWFSCGCTSHH